MEYRGTSNQIGQSRRLKTFEMLRLEIW
ncbi:hypothetical protein M6B38_116225 [Iris pallida]|uniref:Uncharacterized protein n=1 Tax=Iris pallida TaxID=29817 RepID=A0AAX6FRY2_IRIPA|nr:hypothetical protein M6B38_249115 [Iris pallida]KAJ6803641.1 hypothetical protein M6B38_189200 [Iris pallida]KAJ6808025.1 hypothetical protein M6B38_168895 [Iris pallida]KAJ6818778.1 hypothetical protein M6B38_132025 [Iris pallida]KAJ6821436.1 hypothetical protein M6B38_392250 [Iris pallida]